MEEIFGKETFDLVWGQREGVPRKPDPSALFAMAESLGVSSEEVLYIGDSEVDAATGNAADMDTVLVEWGFSITRRTGKGRCIQNCGSGR